MVVKASHGENEKRENRTIHILSKSHSTLPKSLADTPVIGRSGGESEWIRQTKKQSGHEGEQGELSHRYGKFKWFGLMQGIMEDEH